MRSALITATILAVAPFASGGQIRQFSLPVLEKLGNELSHRDEIAAKASDLVYEQHPEFKKVNPQGWITDLGDNADAVYFIAERDNVIVPSYKVVFPHDQSPKVEDIHG